MWCISDCSSPFRMQFHFPLNHDYGRKSKGWQKKRVTTMAKNYGEKLHFLQQSLEKQFLEVSIPFSILFLHCLNQWFHKFQASKPNKKRTTINWSTFQLRINEELIASWSCDDDVPFALIKECTTSLMHPSSEASPGSMDQGKGFQKCVEQPPQKKC